MMMSMMLVEKRMMTEAGRKEFHLRYLKRRRRIAMIAGMIGMYYFDSYMNNRRGEYLRKLI
jgi:hypothetical protein